MIIKDAKSMHLPVNTDFEIFDNSKEEVVVYEIISNILDEIGDLQVKYANEAAVNSEIFSTNEIINKTVTDLFNKDVSSLHIEIANEILKSGTGKKYEIHFKDLDKYYSVSAYLSDENTYITANTDITELKKEEKKLKRTVEKITSAYFELDNEWRFIDANSKIEYILKREREDLVGKIFWEEVPYLVNSEHYIQYNKAKNENIDIHFEIKSKHTGEWYEVHAHPHQNGLTVCFYNINQGKKAEKELIDEIQKLKEDLKVSNKELQAHSEKLQRSKEELKLSNEELRDTANNLQIANKELLKQKEELNILNENINERKTRYNSFVKDLPAVIMKYDRDFKVAYVTTNSRDDNNISTEGFIGKTSRELGIPPEICDIWENAIEKVFKTGKNQNIEFEFPSADGNYPKVFYINFIPESDGKTVKYVLGVSTEITELKNAQNELKEIQDNLEQKVEDRTKEIRMAYESLEHEMNKGYKMEERLLYQANLLENVNDAVIAIDTEFNITSWNKAAKKIYGWDFEEVSGKDSIHLLRINPSNEDKEEIIHSIAEEGIFNREIIHRKKDGTSVYVGSTVMELKDINDEIIGYIALNRDISKRKKVQEELKETIENLKRSNEELERFAYVASHDLQEPLRTIASFTQLLEKRYKGKFDSDADEFMDYIVEAAKRMKEQIVGLLEFSRVATNGEEFQPISTNSILDHVTSNLKASIKECNGEITRDNLPDITGDAAQLQRVFQNLISNAIKFRKPGEPPKIHVSSVKDDEKGDYIFKVSDNGIGIEEQYFDRIFTIFQRLHTREKYKGTGIGLSIVKKIIDRHGGRVWVESSYGVGSTFYFTIPNL